MFRGTKLQVKDWSYDREADARYRLIGTEIIIIETYQEARAQYRIRFATIMERSRNAVGYTLLMEMLLGGIKS